MSIHRDRTCLRAFQRPRLALRCALIALASCGNRTGTHDDLSGEMAGQGGMTGGGSSGGGTTPSEAGLESGQEPKGDRSEVPEMESGGKTDASVGPPFGHPSPSRAYPAYPGFKLWVVEEFDEPLDLDHDRIWTWSDGGFQTHRFVRDAITFEKGAMALTLSDAPQPESCSHSNTGIVPAQRRTSGELRSRYNLFRYGRYEARIKAPMVQPGNPTVDGNYIASLFVFRQPGCQQWREIDLEITGDSASTLGTNLIFANNDCKFTPDKEQVKAFNLSGVNFRTGFVTIGFEWLPGKVTFYQLDDQGTVVPIRELPSSRVPDVPGKIMANLWVFDDTFAFGGPAGKNNILPFRSEYDFIRYYKWDNEEQYPCPAMDASCLSAADLDLAGNNGCDGISNTGDLAGCQQCGTTRRVACTASCP